MTALSISGLTCRYQQANVLSNLNLQIEESEIVCLLGGSGCGKTTLLKAISGLLSPTEGEIKLHGNIITSPQSMIPPEHRGIGIIFQDYALFPHLSVHDNIAFGLQKLSTAKRRKCVQEMLELVNLTGLHSRYPHELSGGQQQRVAIARALANQPSLLLLDEPFSNIDSQVRQRLIREIRDILKRQKVAALFVTHSRDEGFAFADSVAVMHNGRILQKGAALDIYNHPSSHFVAQFIGSGNLLPCKVINNKQVSTPVGLVDSFKPICAQPGQTAQLFVRPRMFTIQKCQCEDQTDSARVTHQQFMGQSLRTEVSLKKNIYVVENATVFPETTAVDISIQPHDLVLFDKNGDSLSKPSGL